MIDLEERFLIAAAVNLGREVNFCREFVHCGARRVKPLERDREANEAVGARISAMETGTYQESLELENGRFNMNIKAF